MSEVTRLDIQRLHDWAKDKTHSGSEPPWAWYQYMKLIEATESIMKGMDSAIATVNLPRLVSQEGNVFQLADSKSQQDSARCRQADEQPRLPM